MGTGTVAVGPTDCGYNIPQWEEWLEARYVHASQAMDNYFRHELLSWIFEVFVFADPAASKRIISEIVEVVQAVINGDSITYQQLGEEKLHRYILTANLSFFKPRMTRQVKTAGLTFWLPPGTEFYPGPGLRASGEQVPYIGGTQTFLNFLQACCNFETKPDIANAL